MKQRIFVPLMFLAVATLAHAASSSLVAVLPGSWQLSDGSFATYAPIGQREFTSLVSGANFPYTLIGDGVAQITNLHGIVTVDARDHATFTLLGQGLNANGIAVVSIKVTGEKTLNTEGTIDVTSQCVSLNSTPCFEIKDTVEGKIVNEMAP